MDIQINLQMMTVIGAILITLIAVVNWIRLKSKHNDFAELLLDQIERDLELRKTLAMGLYMRFKKEESSSATTYSSNFLKEDPLSFEHFVADIIEAKYGGEMFVSKASGDFGVDFENRREDGLYMGQVKCTNKDVNFEAIALVHSNMEKWGAVGGYVITTSSFTKKAVEYADGLGIELINGVELVTMWLETMESDTAYLKQLNPSDI
ncbi:restriction endonuclease [Halalkalibacter alkaliphilus]|uniref:Restriction endonuclease n=1 Tax=Halalkalibacter alkaliphilus TaxID=2917993 RepID=A0A9X2CU82_9BACI|nr:restriction endonuclease [Halalkalibacter alkaliphilus]MCL7748391.1 restriction endonuclease [Halalkalibacter alkaliphilus]